MRRIKIFGAGYTLIEMIVVVMVVSILGATVMLRISSTSDRAAVTHADQLRRDFGHAQALALSWGVPLRFSIAPGGKGYTFRCRVDTGPGTTCPSLGAIPNDPATGRDFSRVEHVPAEPDDWSNDVTITGTNNSLDFDSLGRPIAGAILLGTVSTFTIASGNKSVTVTVQPITGFATTN